jgi:hypothetical protein
MSGDREDVAHLLQVEANGDGCPGPDRADHLGEHVGADRRVKWVGVVDDGVGRVELIAVLAVDGLLGQGSEAGRVRQPKHVNEPCLI